MRTDRAGKGMYKFTFIGGSGATIRKFNPVGDIKMGIGVFEAVYEKHEISQFECHHEGKNFQRLETGLIIGGVITQNKLCSTLLNPL